MTDIQKTASTLEYDKILRDIAALAFTDGAREKILSLKPSMYRETVAKLLTETDDAKKLSSLKGTPSFGDVKYVSDAVERAVKGATLAPAELLNIAAVYRTARSLLSYNHTNKTVETTLDVVFERLFANRSLEDKITRAIISEDQIADEASPELSDIRRHIRSSGVHVREALQKYISGAYSKYLQENIITLRGGRHVIPVKQEYRSEIKGLVHDTSSSGATLFIEPLAVVEINNEIKILEKKERAEMDRILAELSAYCADFSDEINLNYHNITELAVVFAKSEYSYKIDGMSPKIVGGKSVFFEKARHPLIDPKTVVPVDIGVGEDYTTLVITGPNTGGKTVSLKTMGLLVLMAQSGIHIPCGNDSRMSVFEDVLADIGDEQSIEQSLSTFSAHMKNIIRIMGSVSENSLVLFDELGSGTDPVEGAALATAILEKVHETGALCAATTHYAELKVFALETSYAKNASCEFDVETLKPTYKLSIGSPGRSNAFAISKRLGLEGDVINRASSLVRTENKKFENVLEKLEEDRVALDRERTAAEKIRRELETKFLESERDLKKRLAESEKNLEKSREEAKRLVTSAKASSNYVFAELDRLQKRKEEADFGKALTDMKANLKGRLKEAERDIAPAEELLYDDTEDYVLPRPLKPGDTVILKKENLTATIGDILPDKDGNVTVKAGIISVRTNIANIRLPDGRHIPKVEHSKYRTVKPSVKERAIKEAKVEIDVRGKNGEEAWTEVDRFIDESRTTGLEFIRIIHGKGTGALKSALWNFFRGDTRLASYRLGQYGEGDSGVTVLELK
ncbi:endonuclease MutS2 [Clostridia bacterium]|nr:endonuclease MutS2 [Clostridia bacterium]